MTPNPRPEAEGQPIVEWVPFQLTDGVTEDELLSASRALQDEFLAKQPGFVRHELLRSGEEWADVVYWESREAAERAVQQAAESSVCHRYFQLMHGTNHTNPGAGVRYYERRVSYG